jgi:hypothetical protein
VASKVPHAPPSTPEYWDARYTADTGDATVYDWLRPFDSLQPFFTKHLPSPEPNPARPGPSILHLGNGNSVRSLNVPEIPVYVHRYRVAVVCLFFLS